MLPALGLALLGLCVGSFLTTVRARAASGFSGLATGRSCCPACGTTLAAIDLVPVLSWLALRGRCRRCRAPIPAAYPLVELTAAGIGLVAALAADTLPAAAILAMVGWWLLALALIDLETLRLPDLLTLPLGVAGVAASLLGPAAGLAVPLPLSSLLGAALGAGILVAVRWGYGRLRGREGLGLGDAKLAGAAGAWLGAEALAWLILLASLAGLGLALVRHRRLSGELAIPFGPPLALAFWLLLLAAQQPQLFAVFASSAMR